MSFLIALFYFVIVLTIIVFIHEYGHFYVAKKSGVKIEEFAIGFGKKLFGFKDKDGVEWKFCLFPLGGYVKMYGDDNPTSLGGYSDNPTEEELKYALIYKHPLKKTLVAFAGPFMNYVLGFILFFVVFSFNGKPILKPVISDVVKGSYADKAGLKKGDKVISVNGHQIFTFNDIRFQLMYSGYNNVNVEVLRGNKIMNFNTKYKKGDIFGISGRETDKEKLSIVNALKEAVYICYNITEKTVQAVGNIVLHQRGIRHISGPIAIARECSKAGNNGFWALIYFIALISISLGAVNLIPVPMLDGGHVAINLIEFFTRRRFSNFAYKIFVIIGLSFITLLMCIGFVNDLFINR